MLDLEFAELSDPGLVRQDNEDALGHVVPTSPDQVQSQGWLFALADGVGGHQHGEVAAQLAIETVLSGFRKIPKGIMHVSLLPRLVQDANAAVYDAGHAAGSSDTHTAASPRMASTLLLCALRFDSAVLSHVGDSRAYLLRSGAISPLTRDHTMAAEQLRLGLISPSDASDSSGRHILTRSLGSDLFVAADTLTLNILPNDLLLLCSDGLHGLLPGTSIQRILNANPNLDAAAKALVAAAHAAGGHDNISLQLIRVRSVERMGLYRGRPYRLL